MNNKILITTAGLSSIGQGGGISSYAHDLALNLASRGHDVTVFLIKEQKNTFPINVNYNYELFVIPTRRKDEIFLVKQLLFAINNLSPDIIINNDVSYLSGLWPILSESIIRISVMHGFSKKITLTNSGIIGRVATFNWNYVDYIVCQNKKMVIDASDKYKVPLNRLVCIPQTVTLPENIKKYKSSEFTIVFAGGMNAKKGAFEMLKVARLLKRTSLAFKLLWCLPAEKIASEFKEDCRFDFKGKLTREDFLWVLASSDCIIIPTHMDTGPLLLVEAMALGVVPICNNLTESAIPDVIEHGVNGFLISGNNPKKYLDTIINLLKEGNKEKSKAAYSYFQNNLTCYGQIDRFEKLFQSNRDNLRPKIFNDNNVLHYHLYKTSDYPIFSYKRIIPKIINTLEIPMTEYIYNKLFSKILK